MTYTEFRGFIYDWAAANAGIIVVYADQDAPRPNENYITLKVGTIVTIGHRDYQSPDNITEERCVVYDDNITVSLQSYGKDTVDNMQLLKESLQRECVLECLQLQNIAVRNDGDIRNVSSQVDNVIEEHWSYEITFGISNKIVENVGIIADTEISGTYNDHPT